jgi:rhodanese-related sulfurtransferase
MPRRTRPIAKPSRTIRPIWIGALLLLVILVAFFIMLQRGILSSPTAVSKTITPALAQREIENGALILDVREHDEYTQGHIPGSLWIPLGELSSRLQELPHDRLIIVICRTGIRSAQGRDILLTSGFSRVTSVSGGLQAWMTAGFQVVSGEPSNP